MTLFTTNAIVQMTLVSQVVDEASFVVICGLGSFKASSIQLCSETFATNKHNAHILMKRSSNHYAALLHH